MSTRPPPRGRVIRGAPELSRDGPERPVTSRRRTAPRTPYGVTHRDAAVAGSMAQGRSGPWKFGTIHL